jgi:hypothetical protein
MRLLIVSGMLALALSASLTPANARGGCPADGPVGRIYCHCSRQCTVHNPSVATTPVYRPFYDDPKWQVCQAKCVNAAEAARH